MTEYIERDAFLADKKWLYCTDCDKRKGRKRGKMVTLYEIGEAPCKSCGIHDMLEEVEDYPATNARPVVRGKWIPYSIKDCLYYCSNCNALPTTKTNYCPNCGAEMRESADG